MIESRANRDGHRSIGKGDLEDQDLIDPLGGKFRHRGTRRRLVEQKRTRPDHRVSARIEHRQHCRELLIGEIDIEGRAP